MAGPAAMQEAGVKHSDVDHLMVYDAHLPIYGRKILDSVNPERRQILLGQTQLPVANCQ